MDERGSVQPLEVHEVDGAQSQQTDGGGTSLEKDHMKAWESARLSATGGE